MRHHRFALILDTGIFLSPSDIGHGYFGTPESNIFDQTDPVKEAILCAAPGA